MRVIAPSDGFTSNSSVGEPSVVISATTRPPAAENAFRSCAPEVITRTGPPESDTLQSWIVARIGDRNSSVESSAQRTLPAL